MIFENLCFSDYDPYYSPIIATFIIYRGNFVPKEISPTIMFLKVNYHFNYVDWMPAGFKCALHYKDIEQFD